jgi:pimeloyl-ACP methyl ester carboxylesterase
MSTDTTAAATVRPLTVEFPQADVDDLRRRLAATRFPERETVADATQGVRLETITELVRYWAEDYDMGRVEERLNAVPNFVTEIDGLDIHFIHATSPHADALPIVLTHGWPGSIVEMLKVIGPLSDPTAHGGEAGDAFHVIVPSIPGYGLSGRPAETGWDPPHIARAWHQLMTRLGHERYVAQGGDWGASITDLMGAQAPAGLAGVHSNMPGTVQPDISLRLLHGEPAPDGLSTAEKEAYDQLLFLFTKGIGYATEMGNRPQTLYGLSDSPVALASWMLDHDAASLDDIAAAFRGEPVGDLTRDEVLDNITLTWLTNTGISSGRLYWENELGFFDVKGVKVPTALTVFPHELYRAPRSWAEAAYPELIYFNEVDRGNHFAAWQEPELFTSEIRAAFRTLR